MSRARIATVILLGTVLLPTGCAGPRVSSESYVRAGYDFSSHDLVAIVDVGGEIHSERAKNQIADLFTLQLLRKGFAPVQREHVQRLLGEAGFERGDLSPEAFAVEAGRVLQVPAVMIIDIPTLGTENSLTAKILEVENGSALWLGSGTTERPAGQWQPVSQSAFETEVGTSIFESHGLTASTDETATAQAEELLERTLSPAELAPFKAIAVDICRSLPYRTAGAAPSANSFHLPGFGS